MSAPSPLDHPALRTVEGLLDQRQLEEAQRQLADVGQLPGLESGTTYLVTRLLFLRGRLQPGDVAERLREVLRTAPSFPEAQALLRRAEAGTLTDAPDAVPATAPEEEPAVPTAGTEATTTIATLPSQAPPPIAPGETPPVPPATADSPPAPSPPPPPPLSHAPPVAPSQAPPIRSSSDPLPHLSGPADSLGSPHVGSNPNELRQRLSSAPELGMALPPEALRPTPLEVPRVRSNFPSADVPPPREAEPSDSSIPPSEAHDSLEVPRAPSWPPMPAPGEQTRPLASFNAFGSSHPPLSTDPVPTNYGGVPPTDAPSPTSAFLDALEIPQTPGPSAAPTARSYEPPASSEVDSREAPLESIPPWNDEEFDHRNLETQPGTQGAPTSRVRANELEASVATATGQDDDGRVVHVQPQNHISTEPGVGGPEHPGARPVDRLTAPAIPRAPGLPRITPPPDQTPSYIPPKQRSDRAARALEPLQGLRAVLEEPELQRISDLDARGFVTEVTSGSIETRYSEAPSRREFVFSKTPRPAGTPGRAPAGSVDPSPQRRAPKPQRPTSDWPRAPRPRSQSSDQWSARPTAPVDSEELHASLADIVSLLDQQQHDEALRALEALGDEPEHQLLTARALAGCGREQDALAAIAQLCSSSAIDAELRAGAARLLIELKRPDLALAHARVAHRTNPDLALVRLTLAWAAIHELHRTGNRDLARDADDALRQLKGRGGPHPGLTQALRACVQAHTGDAERAIGVAQRALGLDPKSAEALAAITVASVRLQRVHDAQQAWLRLLELDPTQAMALRSHLSDAGIEVPRPGQRHQHGFAAEEDARTVWPALELQILDDERRAAQRQFEQICRERLARVVETGEDEDFPAIGNLAVHTLTEHPAWCHFAPYDLSLWSISRVRAGLGLLYEPSQRLPDDADDFPVVLLVGAYLGQVLCQAHNAHWEGHITDLVDAQVVGTERCWSPFLIVADRLRDGTPIDFGVADDLKLAHPGADQWSEHVAPSVAPPSPWGASPWPRPTLVPRLGRALAFSVVSQWCRQSASGPLDGSVASLGALDAYLNLIAPPAARSGVAEPWLPRVAVLCGAYLGEVLRATVGGAWVTDIGEVTAPADYQVRLGTRVVTPIAEVYQRLTGRSTVSLLDYASQLTRG